LSDSARVARIGVLASGAGSNLQALIDADLGDARIGVVIVNVPGAKAFDRAREAGIPSLCIDHRQHATREDFDRAVVSALEQHGVEWVVLAGFMRIVTPVLLDAFRDRVVNIHPALLPSFPGVNAHKRALEAGVKLTGCTVHLVDEGCDTGPILAQVAVPVLEGDDEARLKTRILKQEHRLLPAVIRALIEGRLHIDGRRARLRGFEEHEDRVLSNPALLSNPKGGSA
jgi:phosphoribosylglycinamide formyltransferase-1